MGKGFWILVLIIVIVLVWWVGRDNEAAGSVAVPLTALGANGVSGTATLSYEGMESPVTVKIDLPDAVVGGDHPAHVHQGSCPTPGPVVYTLDNVKDGASETTLEQATINDFRNELSINVHLSADEIGTYLSCGDIAVPEAN